jgi:hypothetical protein
MINLKPGDEARIVEHNDATRLPVQNGRVYAAEVIATSELYIRIRYIDGARAGDEDSFWRESGWRAWDGSFYWRLRTTRGQAVTKPPLLSFTAQIRIWGYVVDGQPGGYLTQVAEGRPGDRWVAFGALWDDTAADLEGRMIAHGDEPYRRVKDFAALPWVAEHCIRGHADWPGL